MPKARSLFHISMKYLFVYDSQMCLLSYVLFCFFSKKVGKDS